MSQNILSEANIFESLEYYFSSNNSDNLSLKYLKLYFDNMNDFASINFYIYLINLNNKN